MMAVELRELSINDVKQALIRSSKRINIQAENLLIERIKDDNFYENIEGTCVSAYNNAMRISKILNLISAPCIEAIEYRNAIKFSL